MKSLVLLLLLFSCAHGPERAPSSIPFPSWKSYLDHKYGSLSSLFASDGKFLEAPWKQSHEITFEKRPPAPSQLPEVALSCGDKKLWPTHPQQTTKEYLFAVVASFDRIRLPGTMSSCITPNFNKKHCLRSQDANVIVMSDTYHDSCGNLYRGYWVVSYRTGGGPNKSEDNMGTLLSKGRTQYEKAKAQFAGEYEPGYTYPVEAQNFLFLSQLLPGDQRLIRLNREQALKFGFKLKGRSFQAP